MYSTPAVVVTSPTAFFAKVLFVALMTPVSAVRPVAVMVARVSPSGSIRVIVAVDPAASLLRTRLNVIDWSAFPATINVLIDVVETTVPLIAGAPVPASTTDAALKVPPLIVTSKSPSSVAAEMSTAALRLGLTALEKYWTLDTTPSPLAVVIVPVAAEAARATGTNAEPKSPASKPAVATAVANFFLMNYCESQSAICHINDTNLGLHCT